LRQRSIAEKYPLKNDKLLFCRFLYNCLTKVSPGAIF
jgi:hypothetical protein